MGRQGQVEGVELAFPESPVPLALAEGLSQLRQIVCLFQNILVLGRDHGCETIDLGLGDIPGGEETFDGELGEGSACEGGKGLDCAAQDAGRNLSSD